MQPDALKRLRNGLVDTLLCLFSELQGCVHITKYFMSIHFPVINCTDVEDQMKLQKK